MVVMEHARHYRSFLEFVKEKTSTIKADRVRKRGGVSSSSGNHTQHVLNPPIHFRLSKQNKAEAVEIAHLREADGAVRFGSCNCSERFAARICPSLTEGTA